MPLPYLRHHWLMRGYIHLHESTMYEMGKKFCPGSRALFFEIFNHRHSTQKAHDGKCNHVSDASQYDQRKRYANNDWNSNPQNNRRYITWVFRKRNGRGFHCNILCPLYKRLGRERRHARPNHVPPVLRRTKYSLQKYSCFVKCLDHPLISWYHSWQEDICLNRTI